MNEDSLKITKLDAAQRQLDCAIELWFLDKDPVSMHTLAAASYQILHDIKAGKKLPRKLLYDLPLIDEQNREKWIKALKRPMNFFKHADQDPNSLIEFNPISTLGFMVFAVAALDMLGVETQLRGACPRRMAYHAGATILSPFLQRELR
jgi:hypothetical protein